MGRNITEGFSLKPEASLEQLQINLRPGGDLEELFYGFLGNDELHEEVIETDRKTLVMLGLTHEQFAKTIEDVFEHMPATINRNPLFLFEYIHSPGCPWEGWSPTSFMDVSLKVTEIWLCNPKHFWKLIFLLRFWDRNKRLKKLKELVDKDWVFVLSDLHPHLIRKHHFFEGRCTPYRVDPERFVRWMGPKNIFPYKG